MKVNKSSWHYRLNRSMDCSHYFGHRPIGVCKYFWLTLLNICKLLLMGLFVALGIVACLALTVGTVYGLYMIALLLGTPLELNGFSEFQKFSYFNACVVIIFVTCLLTPWGFKNLLSHISKTSKKEPGLVKSYIKAKKNKFCPNVEFKD